MYDVALRRIRTQTPYEGFEGSYFSSGHFRYHPLTEFNLKMALSLNLISADEAEWAWSDLLDDEHWESVRLLSQLSWLLETKRPERICVIRDAEQALDRGHHRAILEKAGYQRVGRNRIFERWKLYGAAAAQF